jgi:hypothetical protein
MMAPASLREWAVVIAGVILVVISAVLMIHEDWYGLAGAYVFAGFLFWYARRTLRR